MNPLTWSSDLSVGVAELDDQHKRLFDIINQLTRALSQGCNALPPAALAQDMEEYARVHFAREEELLQIVNYPARAAHIAEHQVFTQKIAYLKEAAQTGQKALLIEMLWFLSNWLITHIRVTDSQYAPYLKDFAAQKQADGKAATGRPRWTAHRRRRNDGSKGT